MFQEGEALLERDGNLVADALGPRLAVIPADGVGGTRERRAGGHEPHARDDAGDDGALEMFVVREVLENRVASAAGERELDVSFAETAL